MSHAPTVLFVYGFSPFTRARDLGWEFERYGPLVRVEIPGRQSGSRTMFGFAEFEHSADAEVALRDMHGRRFDGNRISIEWARRASHSSSFTPIAAQQYHPWQPAPRNPSPARPAVPLSPPRSMTSEGRCPGRGRSRSPADGMRDGRTSPHDRDLTDRRDSYYDRDRDRRR